MKEKKPPYYTQPIMGAPTKYKTEYCQLLIEHMRKGGSIDSFGAKVGACRATIYNWFDEFPDFLDSKKVGWGHLIDFYENLFKTAGTGQLRRIKSEKLARDKDGNPVFHPVTKEPVMDVEWEAATPAQALLIFLTKNVAGWRDRQDIEISGKDGGSINFSNLKDDELKAKIAELLEKAKKVK